MAPESSQIQTEDTKPADTQLDNGESTPKNSSLNAQNPTIEDNTPENPTTTDENEQKVSKTPSAQTPDTTQQNIANINNNTTTAPNAAQPPQKTTEKAQTKRNIEQILAIKVPLIVKIAEKKMTMEAILKLSMGSLIHFDKDANQHSELMVKNTTIGLGQPVKLGEKFGLKITHIGTAADTIRILGGNP